MNRKEEIDARIETLQGELEELKKRRERIEIPVTERIKTFDDAIDELGSKHPLVRQYMAANGDELFTRSTIAYIKLQIVAAALNEGWFPDLQRKEKRWYPYYKIYTGDETDDIFSNEIYLFGGTSDYDASCGLAFVSSLYAWSGAFSYVSARLAVKSEEISDYFGNQFINIWAEYLLDGCEIEKHDTEV